MIASGIKVLAGGVRGWERNRVRLGDRIAESCLDLAVDLGGAFGSDRRAEANERFPLARRFDLSLGPIVLGIEVVMSDETLGHCFNDSGAASISSSDRRLTDCRLDFVNV